MEERRRHDSEEHVLFRETYVFEEQFQFQSLYETVQQRLLEWPVFATSVRQKLAVPQSEADRQSQAENVLLNC